MAMVIGTNVLALSAQRHLDKAQADASVAMERLSSGRRINSAMDDAAGLTISHSLDSKITSLGVAVRNGNDAIALTKVAEGALEEVSSMLVRMRELATQSLNGTYTNTDRSALEAEWDALSSEITRISSATQFNGISVLGSTSTLNYQLGSSSGDTVSMSTKNIASTNIGTITDLTTTVAGASSTSGSVTSNSIFTDPGTGAFRLFDASETIKFGISVDGGASVQIDLTMSELDYYDSSAGGINFFDLVTDLNSRLSGVTVSWERIGVGEGALKFTSDSTGSGSSITLSDIDFGSGTSKLKLASISSLSTASISTSGSASSALSVLDDAQTIVDGYRSNLGATSNRIDHTIRNLMSRIEHQSAARSGIQDADYAVELADLAKSQVLQQAGTAMLSQANASLQNVLSLLK